jgi:hypothetical protein
MQVSFVSDRPIQARRFVTRLRLHHVQHWQQHEHHLRFVHAKRLMSCVHSQPGSFFRTRYFAVGAQGDQRAGINAHPEREGHSICAGAVLSCRLACGVDWDVMLLAPQDINDELHRHCVRRVVITPKHYNRLLCIE